ncbi:MAG: protein kinase [bacterium]
MSTRHLELGQVVSGRFLIEDVIGEGGMGTIYLARHVKLPRAFALKLLKPELAADPDFVARFLREAVAASQVIHPNVVNVTDYGQLEDGSYFIAMEHLDGRGLDDVLLREERLALPRVLDILIQLADALDYCHCRGIVHRDLKTENILLCTIRGRPDVVKLVDFGIARMIGPELTQWQITQGGMIFGTPEYLSPERALDEDVDGRSDIYALGIIAFELLTGAPPFTGKYTQLIKAHLTRTPVPPSTRVDEPIPGAFDSLVLRCLAKKPAARYQTCAELQQELLRIRGLVAGEAERPADSRRAGNAQRPSTDGAWSTLSVRRPTSGDHAQPPVASLEALGQAVSLASEASAIRGELRNVIKELAAGLGDPGVTSSMLRQLEDVLGLERQSRALTAELALLVEQQERLRVESDDYAFGLRQLQHEITAVAQRDEPTASAFERQLQALRHHLDRLCEGRDRRHQKIERELQQKSGARLDKETQLAQLYFALYAGVVCLRGTDRGLPLERLFVRLDELQSRLSGCWRELR